MAYFIKAGAQYHDVIMFARSAEVFTAPQELRVDEIQWRNNTEAWGYVCRDKVRRRIVVDRANLVNRPDPYWKIFRHRGNAATEDKLADLIDIVAYKHDDPNHGLPEWVFDEDLVIPIMVDVGRDLVEWVPPIGPNPIWSSKWSEFKTDDQMFIAFERWAVETYGPGD